MGTVSQALKKYTALRNELPAIIRETVDENKEGILALNKEQLKRGLNSRGEKVGSYKNKRYEAMKKNLNPLAGGNVDLELTGVFKQGWFIEVVDNKIITETSQDIKSRALVTKYSELIFGLSEGNRKEFIANTLRPAFIQKIKQFLNK